MANFIDYCKYYGDKSFSEVPFNDVDALICGGIGGGAQMGVASMGIKLYGGVQGKADDAVKALLEGRLEQNSNANCNHHHDEGHNCSHSSCGGHCHH